MCIYMYAWKDSLAYRESRVVFHTAMRCKATCHTLQPTRRVGLARGVHEVS
jgi:hypothetical protein